MLKYIYYYTRNGVEFVTPNINLAFTRNQVGEVKQQSYVESE